MAIELADFLRLRPMFYHLTDQANLESFARSRLIEPAAALIRRSGQPDWLSRRRAVPVSIEVDGRSVVLKDQKPLIFANAALADGWQREDFVAYLNEHVFFWPGDERGPIKHGARLFDRYEGDGPAIVRVPSAGLLAVNPDVPLLLCAFNSGAPRMNGGKPVPRGPDLFASPGSFSRTPGKVVEAVFRGAVRLPASAQILSPSRGWQPLGASD